MGAECYITFRTRGAERRTVAFGYVGLLESYCAGSIDIAGDIALAFRAGIESGYDRLPNPLLKLRNCWHEWRFSNRSIAQAKASARYHYGLGEAFYRYWLDTVGMMYPCAYWAEGTTTLEHAGRDQLPAVVRAHADALKPGGLGVIHFIGHVGTRDTELFIRKHIFPGGWIPSLSQALDCMERCGLEVLDVENLRRHYALTLDCWGERFDRNWEAIHALDPRRFDEAFRRKWRAYLWSCAAVFRSKSLDLNLFQVTVSKGAVGTGYPFSRTFLYRPPV